MTSVIEHLTLASATLSASERHLDHALEHAQQRGYHSNYLAAIKRALAHNLTTLTHVGNVATVLRRRPEPPL